MANKKLPAAFAGVGGEWAWNHLSPAAQQSYWDRENSKSGSGGLSVRPAKSSHSSKPVRPSREAEKEAEKIAMQQALQQLLLQQKSQLEQEMKAGFEQLDREEQQDSDALKQGYQNTLATLLLQKQHADRAAQQNYDSGSDRLNQETDRQLAEAYASTMADRRNLAQQLAAQGITGGMSESVLMNLANEYGKNRNRLETGRQEALTKLLQGMQKSKEENQKLHAGREEKARQQYQERYFHLRQQMRKEREDRQRYYQSLLQKLREKELSL